MEPCLLVCTENNFIFEKKANMIANQQNMFAIIFSNIRVFIDLIYYNYGDVILVNIAIVSLLHCPIQADYVLY